VIDAGNLLLRNVDHGSMHSKGATRVTARSGCTLGLFCSVFLKVPANSKGQAALGARCGSLQPCPAVAMRPNKIIVFDVLIDTCFLGPNLIVKAFYSVRLVLLDFLSR
jgi:hypothetical protein